MRIRPSSSHIISTLTEVNERGAPSVYPWQASSRRGEVAVRSTPLWDSLRSALIAGVACLSLCFVLPAEAAEKSLIDKGEALVRKNCSPCHAIGKEGDSPHKEAPPFRTLSAKYPIDNLAESPKGSCRATRTCRSSCSARTMSRRSFNTCRASSLSSAFGLHLALAASATACARLAHVASSSGSSSRRSGTSQYDMATGAWPFGR